MVGYFVRREANKTMITVVRFNVRVQQHKPQREFKLDIFGFNFLYVCYEGGQRYFTFTKIVIRIVREMHAGMMTSISLLVCFYFIVCSFMYFLSY